MYLVSPSPKAGPTVPHVRGAFGAYASIRKFLRKQAAEDGIQQRQNNVWVILAECVIVCSK